jgi:hypothetical protein
MEQVLPQISELVDILSIDTNGYIVPELISLIATWRFPSSGMLLKNSLCGREQGGAFSLLASVDGDRKKLDKILLWIAGSQADSGMRAKSPLELVNYALRMESVSSIVAHRIAPLVGLPHQSLVDLLIALGLNGPLTRKVKIVEYSSEGGSPFLSNFALLDKLNPISSRGESIGQLRDFLQAAAESFVTTQASISLDTVKRSKSTTLSFTCPGKPHAKKVLILPKDIKEFAEEAFR